MILFTPVTKPHQMVQRTITEFELITGAKTLTPLDR